MGKKVLSYIAFFILLFLADRAIGLLISKLSQKQVADKRIGMLVNDTVKHDLIIIGSSRALNNYNPALIANETGLKSYNLGINGSDIFYHEALIDLIITNVNKPSVIVYSIDDHATFYKMQNVLFRKDVMYPYVHDDRVNEIICHQIGRNEIATEVMWTYRQNMNFINAIKYLYSGPEIIDYKTNNLDSLGANILDQRPGDPYYSFRVRKLDLNQWKININQWAAFRRIQEKCKAHDIKLVFVLPPVFTTNFPGYKAVVKSAILEPNHLLDYANVFNDSTLFFNVDHLNRRGANLFTTMLVRDLKKIKI